MHFYCRPVSPEAFDSLGLYISEKKIKTEFLINSSTDVFVISKFLIKKPDTSAEHIKSLRRPVVTQIQTSKLKQICIRLRITEELPVNLSCNCCSASTIRCRLFT